MHTALLKGSKMAVMLFSLRDCEMVERELVIAHSCMDLAINQWVYVLL